MARPKFCSIVILVFPEEKCKTITAASLGSLSLCPSIAKKNYYSKKGGQSETLINTSQGERTK